MANRRQAAPRGRWCRRPRPAFAPWPLGGSIGRTPTRLPFSRPRGSRPIREGEGIQELAFKPATRLMQGIETISRERRLRRFQVCAGDCEVLLSGCPVEPGQAPQGTPDRHKGGDNA